MRAGYRGVVRNLNGDVVPSASVEVRQVNTATKITEIIYADATGGSTLSNPFNADSNGQFQFYLDVPKRVDLYSSVFGTIEDIDVVHAGIPSRPATKIVAASDATAAWKDAADYVCDGTNDNVELQAAIDAVTALGSAWQGGKVLLSEGAFNLGAYLQMKPYVTLEGQGPWSTLLNPTGTVTPAVMLGTGVWANGYNMNLRDLAVAVVSGGIGLHYHGALHCDTERVSVIGYYGTGMLIEDFQWLDFRKIHIQNVTERGVKIIADLNSDGHLSFADCAMFLKPSGAVANATPFELSGSHGSFETVLERCHFLTHGNAGQTGIKLFHLSSTGGENHIMLNSCCFEVLDGNTDIVGFQSDINDNRGTVLFNVCTWFGGNYLAYGFRNPNGYGKYTFLHPRMLSLKSGGVGIAASGSNNVFLHDFQTVGVTTPYTGTVKNFQVA